MQWKDAKQQLLQNANIKREYDKVDLAYEVGNMISEARIALDMTQTKLAELVGTQQPSIARIEKGSHLPSLSFLQKIAKAFNTQLLPPRFQFMTEEAASTVFVYIGESQYGHRRERINPPAKKRELSYQDMPVISTGEYNYA